MSVSQYVTTAIAGGAECRHRYTMEYSAESSDTGDNDNDNEEGDGGDDFRMICSICFYINDHCH